MATRRSIESIEKERFISSANNNDESLYAYCAGLFDGEGNIHICRVTKSSKCFRIEIIIANTNIECLKFVQNVFNFGYVQVQKRGKSCSEKYNHWKILYRYRLQGTKNCMILLEKIIPYLIIKKLEAVRALNWCKLKLNDPYVMPYDV